MTENVEGTVRPFPAIPNRLAGTRGSVAEHWALAVADALAPDLVGRPDPDARCPRRSAFVGARGPVCNGTTDSCAFSDVQPPT